MEIKKTISKFCQNKQIIVIGNSQQVLEKNHGTRIDQYDVVVRMNHGYPRPEWKKHLGSRTDIWICAFNNRALQLKEYGLFRPNYAIRLNNETHIHPKMEKKLLRWDMANWEKVKALTRINKYPSTGLVTIYFFLEFLGIDHITITGFDFFQNPTFYHLKNGFQPDPNIWHQPELERKYISNFIQNGKISLLQ